MKALKQAGSKNVEYFFFLDNTYFALISMFQKAYDIFITFFIQNLQYPVAKSWRLV